MNKIYFLFLSLCLTGYSSNGQFKPVSVTGFNADIIANGVGDASTSVTANADAGNFAFVSSDFLDGVGGGSPTYSLPADGWIYSASTPGLSFKIADYAGANTSRLATSPSTFETLTFDTAQSAVEVDFLAYSGSGASTMDITLNFSNGTSQSITGITVADWYNGTPFVIQGIGRINVTTNAFSGDASNPRLYAVKIAVDPANYGSNISSINISKTNTTTSVLGIMAVSVLKFNPAYASMDVSGFNADVIADGVNDPMTSTTNDVDGATPPYAFVAGDYQHDGSCTVPARHMPNGGTIASAAVPGMPYQLAPYTANNDLRLTSTDVGTLTFTTPTPAKAVYLLGVGGNGAAQVSATVTFTDLTTQFFDNLSLSDWYSGTTNIVTQGIGRVKRTTTDCTGLETSTASPKLYQVPLLLDVTNYNKSVQSVTITRIDGVTGFAGIANIMGVSVELTYTILPVTMMPLQGRRSPVGNVLQWSTKTERNNTGFEIDVSSDGRAFSNLNFVKTKATLGNSASTISYSYKDVRSEGSSYYRLRQVSKDGKSSFSNIVFINGSALSIASVYPNPAVDRLKVIVSSAAATKVQLNVCDLTGRVLLSTSSEVAVGEQAVPINVRSLAPGAYLLKVLSGVQETHIMRFIKQ